jgi:hypothetical protein
MRHTFNKWIYRFATNPKVTRDQLERLSQFIGHGQWTQVQDALPALPSQATVDGEQENESVLSSETLRTSNLKTDKEAMEIEVAHVIQLQREQSNDTSSAGGTLHVTIKTVTGTNIDDHPVLSNFYGKAAETAQDWCRNWDVFAVPKKLPSRCSNMIDEHIGRSFLCWEVAK